MIHTTKLLLSTFLILLSYTFMQGQDIPAEQGPIGRHSKVMDNLELTDAQREEAQQIRSNSKEKIASIKNDESIVDKRAALKEVRQSEKKAFQQILTKEQRVKFDAGDVRRQNKRKERGEKEKPSKLKIKKQ